MGSFVGARSKTTTWGVMNLAFKQYLYGHITDERLHDFGIVINSLKHFRKQFEQAWRHGAGDPDDDEGGVWFVD